MRIPLRLTLLAAFLAGGAALAEGPQTSTLQAVATAGGRSCATITVAAGTGLFADDFESGDTSAWGDPRPRFSATRILDLQFGIHFSSGALGDRLLHLRLSTPRGHHYQTLTVPVSSGLTKRGAMRAVEGFPRPLPVQVLGGSAGSSVAVSFPVAGTPIVSSGLYGEWTVEALLDDATAPCANTHFVLSP